MVVIMAMNNLEFVSLVKVVRAATVRLESNRAQFIKKTGVIICRDKASSNQMAYK